MNLPGQPKVGVVEEEKPPPVSDQLKPFYPYWIKESPEPQIKKFYTKNGHLKLIKSLKVQIVSDIKSAHELWKEFSPNRTLFDTWEFRLAFYNAYKYTPHFIVLKTDTVHQAVLPLWHEEDMNRYVFFGSVWQEENNFFVKDPIFSPLLLSISPSPLYLNALSADTISKPADFVDFTSDDPKFILDLTTISSVDDFLMRFKKKRRYNMRRDWKLIESKKPEIIIDNYSNLDKLIELSMIRFAEKGEDTDWEDKRRIEAFKQVIELGRQAESYTVRMITIKIGDAIAAVDLIAIFNGCYYPLKCGYDVSHFPGIGNYVNLFEIKDALSLNMKKMDFLEIDYGWKNKWFDQIPLFRYQKDYNADEVGDE